MDAKQLLNDILSDIRVEIITQEQADKLNVIAFKTDNPQ